MSWNRHHLPVVMVMLLTALALPLTANAQKALPGWTVVRPEKPMTPEDFRKHVQEHSEPEAAKAEAVLLAGGNRDGGDLMTLRTDPNLVLDAEIDALARGLKYDPGLMYKFVHDHVRFYPMWGTVKSAAMTLMDRSGDAFDQAALLIALLTEAASAPQAPHTIANIRYVVGTIQLNAAQITNWLGIPDSSSVVSDLLAAGGIPRQSFGNPDGTINYVSMSHVWVKATIDGVVYEFDPSFKSHTLKAGLTDSQLESALGYTRDAFLTSAQQNATIGSDYVKDLNKGNITGSLSTYSTSLVDYIKDNSPGGDLADIIGGKTIVPAPDSTLPPPLPYPKTTIGQYALGGLPYNCKTWLQIQHGGINQTLDTSTIYGHRLLLTFEPMDNPSLVRPSLWLDGALLAQAWQVSPGSDFDVTLSVGHPGLAWEATTVKVKAGGMWHIVNGWGDVGTRIIELHRRILQQSRHEGLADDTKEVLGESFTLTGLTWAAEVCRMHSLVSQISDCTMITHHLIGVVGQYQAPYIDMPLCRGGIASHTGSSEAETAAFLAVGGQASAYEHGVIHQLQDYGAVSTIKLLDIANERTTDDKIFVTSVALGNWTSVQSQLSGYSQVEKDNVYNNYIQQGYTVYLPQYGDVGEGDWAGVGFLAYRASPLSAGYIISGDYSGGHPTDSSARNDPGRTQAETGFARGSTRPDNVRSFDPIDLVTGACTYDHTDIAVGNGGFPFGLQLGRQYNSIQRLEDGPLGRGWTHGFDITTKVTSDSFQAMGEDSPLDAAANIVGLYVAFDLFRDLSTSALLKTVVASIGEKWLMDQMIDNIVVVQQGHEAMQFLKLPDGSFNPPPGKALTLIQEADNTYLLKDPAGNFLDFDANHRAVQWSDPHDNVVDFAYNANGKLSTVTGKIGGSVACRSLSFTYETADPNHIDTVTDSADRSVSFDYDPAGNLTSYTDPEDHVTTFEYYGADDPNEGLMWKLFYPNHPTQPYATNVYDALGRARRQTNAAGHVYDYYYAYYRTEEVEPLQTPPSGPAARYSKVYWFDDHGRTVAVQDQLGRKATTEYDGQQRPIRVVSPTGASVEYSYDLNHNVVETRSKPVASSGSPDIVQTATYTTHETAGRWLNRITSQTDAAGHTTAYEYDFSNPIYQAEFGDLRKVTLPTVTDYRGQAVTATQQFTYTASGQPETVTDANGIVTKYEYDSPAQGGGLKTTIGDFGEGPGYLNLTTHLTYDRAGDVNSVTDAQGHVTHSAYDPSRRLQETIAPAPLCYRTRYEYDADGQLQYVTQRAGGNNFTADPHCVAVWRLEDGALTSDSQGVNTLTNSGVVAGVPQEGLSSGSFQSSAATQLSRADADLSSGFPLKTGDPNKEITVCFWVRPQSLGSDIRALVSKYDYVHLQASFLVDLYITGHVGHLTGYNGGASYEQVAYDAPPLAVGSWYHVAATWRDSDRHWGLRVWSADAAAVMVDVGGTKQHHISVTAAAFCLGNAASGNIYFDGLLDEVAVFNSVLTAQQIDQIRQGIYGGRAVVLAEHTYTATGRPATTRGPYPEDPTPDEYAANFTQYTYDTLDRPWTVTDANNNVTETRYWPDGQVWRTIDAAGHAAVTHTYYEPNGLLSSVQDAKGNATVYDYDHFRRPFRTWYADDTYEQITYDAYGRVAETRTRAGALTQPTYDALNRVVSKTVAGSTTTYGYDIGGRTVTTTDPVGPLRHTFDRLGRVETATQTNGAQVSYDYDTLGRRSKLTYPDDSFITYSYDSLGRLTDINDSNDDALTHYEYDDLSRRVSVLYANGTSTSYTYSPANRLLQLGNATATQPSTYGYSYDLVGSRTGMLVNGTEPHGYTYDNIYQLTNANYPDGYFQADTTFTYDDAGNRSQVDSPPTAYVTNSLNQYSSVGSDTFSYDTNGNLTGDGHSSYTYNAENQLLSATIGTRTIQYTYDAAGRRIRKAANGRTTQYVYDGAEAIAEYDGEGTVLRTFIYGPGIDEPICMHAYNLVIGDLTGDGLVNLEDLRALAPKWLTTDGCGAACPEPGEWDPLCDLNQDGRIDNADTDLLSAQWRKTAEPVQVFYYHFDGLGSVVALSDAAGNVVETYAYDVYGRSQPTGIGHGNPYRFTARRWDPETGLYDYRARYYNPTIGRFLQPDPLGYGDGINWYTYCGNNPIVFVDPLGLCYKPTAGEWAGAVAGGIGQGLYNTLIDPIAAVGNYYGAFRDSGMSKAGAGFQAVNMGLGKAIGYGTIAEGLMGFDLRSGQDLSLGGRALNVGLGAAQVGLTLGGGRLGGKGGAKGVKAYEVGTVDALRARSIPGDKLSVHHVGQAHPMEQLVPGYNPAAAPGIVLPHGKHLEIPNLSGQTNLTARQVLARDVRNLRTYTDAPNSSLEQLIDMNKQMYPGAFKR